jgi:putative nucleotidyltransferase with HDIG domain
MRTATKIYVFFIVSLTLAAGAILAFAAPGPTVDDLSPVLVFGAFATCAEMLAFVLTRNQMVGSVAFIPFLATVLVTPSWVAVACVAMIKLLVEAFRRGRTHLIKAVFNACTHGLAIASAIAVYLTLGGESLLAHRSNEILSLSGAFGVPAFFAFLAAFIVITLIVAGVLALESRESLSSVLRQKLSVSGIGGDLLTAPVVFVLAWLYSSYGPMLAGTAFLPIVGLTQLNRVQIELEETNQELLQLMVKSIEARDPYTSGHSRRVSRYAALIAKSLGLSQREIDTIATAALLHDVGKIYEKYAPILRNPGRLTPEEWTIMQEHPADGANLISTISRLSALVPSVRHHHENWDGSGYPDQIAGESIPLASRIIMFADTIDAMTSERPYRGPLSEAEVRSEILRGRGRQFDPRITDRLMAAGVWNTLFAVEKSSIGRPLTLIADRETA